MRMVSTEVQIMDGQDIAAGLVARIPHKGVAQFEISPVSSPFTSVAVFNPEAGGKPARITLYQYAPGGGDVQTAVNTRTVFSASEATMRWNSTGTSLLAHTSSDLDSSNTSYYGATGLFLLSTDGVVGAMVQQSKDGPVYDVKWSPAGDKFVVAAGNMPSHCTMYDARGEAIFEFGAAHRNTISWAPHGRFLCLAGFGNLAGEMDFYDTLRKHRKMGSNSAHCTVGFAWSPDSRFFLTAVLAPRMNVDNGFKIYKYNGEGPIAAFQEEQLYDAQWQPAPPGTYPNRGPSPRREGSAPEAAAGGGGASASGVVVGVPAVKPKAAPYRPPGATGAASFMQREPAGVTVGKVVKPGDGQTKGPAAAPPPAKIVRVIPGLPPQAQTAAGAAKKKGGGGGGGGSNVPAPKEAKPPPPPPAPAAKAVPPPPPTAAVAAGGEVEDAAKRIKTIKKKLKQIEEIKARAAANPTTPLNEDQVQKVGQLSVLIQELAQLEAAEAAGAAGAGKEKGK